MDTTEMAPLERADGVLTALEKTDATGMVSFEVSARFVREHGNLPKGPDGTSVLIKQEFYDQPLLLSGLENIKGFDRRIEASHMVTEDKIYVARFNLLRILHVNSITNAARSEMVDFYRSVADFFASHPHVNCDVQITNGKAERKIAGNISCRLRDENEGRMVEDESSTQAMKKMACESQAIQEHITGVARAINAMGPHSWMCLTEDQVLGPQKGPRYLHMRDLQNNRPARSTP